MCAQTAFGHTFKLNISVWLFLYPDVTRIGILNRGSLDTYDLIMRKLFLLNRSPLRIALWYAITLSLFNFLRKVILIFLIVLLYLYFYTDILFLIVLFKWKFMNTVILAIVLEFRDQLKILLLNIGHIIDCYINRSWNYSLT